MKVHADLLRVYALVLAEGTVEDVRTFVDAEVLLSVWSQLLLPTFVREAWDAWFAERGLQPA